MNESAGDVFDEMSVAHDIDNRDGLQSSSFRGFL